MPAEVVPGTGSMPRRARHLIPTQLPRRGEVVAAFAVLVLVAHLLLAQLTLVLAIVFAAMSKTTRWRLWWLAAPAAAGLTWTLAIGPRAAAAGFTAGPVFAPRSPPSEAVPFPGVRPSTRVMYLSCGFAVTSCVPGVALG